MIPERDQKTLRVDPHPGIFYGWYIAFLAFLANFMSVGTGFYIFNAFMEPLSTARGWSRTDINIALVIGMFFGIFSQLIYGTLVMRVGPRILMFLGPFIAGTAFIFLFRAEELWVFYIWCAILFLGNAAYGGIVANTVVSNWFEEKRGRALGLATSGVSLSGAVLPFIAMMIIMKTGLSQAAIQIGLIISLLGPAAWLVVRNWPEDYGLAPDGLRSLPGKDRPSAHPDDKNKEADTFVWTLGKLVRTGTFWKLGVSYGLSMIGIVGVMTQLKPRFVDEGFGDMTGMALMAATALVGALGKFFWGVLCDRYESRRIVSFLFAMNAVGLAFSLIHGQMIALTLFIILFGFAMGGVMSTYPIIIADLFGRKSFPFVTKFVSLFFLLQLSGYVISGQSFDNTGSYDMAYKIYTFLFLVSALLVYSLKRPQSRLNS
ncbi:MAG: MFS transporter [Proteobacteria bacterium]|nr:MFS transporter [Pseudomonadota bacterium]